MYLGISDIKICNIAFKEKWFFGLKTLNWIKGLFILFDETDELKKS